MASSTFSSVLANLYPRESDELQTLLQRHHVGYGRPEDVFGFPAILAASDVLQQSLRTFVLTSRDRPRGPVSRSAMLHLLLSGIGGPRAVDLGPEADLATALITSFLEELGGWPEDAFADLDSPTSFTEGNAAPKLQAARRVRSLAASLATQNSFPGQDLPEEEPSSEQAVEQRPEPGLHGTEPASLQPSTHEDSDTPSTQHHTAEAATLQAIAHSLAKLEESYRATADRLDIIQDKLHQLEGAGSGSSPAAEAIPVRTREASATATRASSSRQSTRQSDLPANAPSRADAGAARSWPTPTAERSTPFSVSPDGIDPVRELAPVVVATQASLLPVFDPATLPLTSDELPEPAAEPIDPVAFVRPDRSAAAERRAEPEPAGEWKKLFTAPVKPKRTIAVVPVVVACLIIAAIVIAVVLFVRSQAPTPTADFETGPAPAPAAALPQPEPASTSPATQAPRSPSQNNARMAANDSERSPASGSSTTGATDRVLGARETYQPKVTGESFPSPKQPTFVAASAMDQRLVYSPRPQHPRVAGLVGLSGMVVMEVMVSSDGSVDDVHVLGGHHLLRDAAVNAVRTWRYRPVLQNGRAVPVRTIVRIDFSKTDDTRAKN